MAKEDVKIRKRKIVAENRRVKLREHASVDCFNVIAALFRTNEP